VKDIGFPQADRSTLRVVLRSLPPTVRIPRGGAIPGAPPPKLLGLLDGVDIIYRKIMAVILLLTI